MSKRTQEYFESFKEFTLLCDREGIHSPPKSKRPKLASNKINEPQIQKSILSTSLSLSPSPSPPQILLTKLNIKPFYNESTVQSIYETYNILNNCDWMDLYANVIPDSFYNGC